MNVSGLAIDRTHFLFVIFIIEKKWNFPYIYNKGNI